MWIARAKAEASIFPSAVSHNILLIKRACTAQPKRLHGFDERVFVFCCQRSRIWGERLRLYRRRATEYGPFVLRDRFVVEALVEIQDWKSIVENSTTLEVQMRQ